ncbi:Ku protein [Paeniglutamicibacter antarcticus]|uniref:Non-homologous end joining protein Ku n=1 Tax=Paeniglutamicibacter antarcticus TaxID=494023 RepID=A0ABP9TLG0_9MICC
MRSIWTGSIAFGLVNVPVKAYGATEDHDVSLHQVHDIDGGRIRYQRRCEVCGKKIGFEDIDKAYDDGDRTVILTEVDLKSLPAEKSREIEVVQFVPNEQIDPIMLERSYYLEPDTKSPKAYALLVETLENTELTAVVKFALRQKMRLGALRVRGKVLVLQGILWNDEVREADFASNLAKGEISPQELKMSSALVEQFRGDFNPGEFEDEYQLELRTLIAEKLKQGDSLDTEATFGDKHAASADAGRNSNDVIDLMEALKRSIDKKHAGTTKAAAKKTTGDTPSKITKKANDTKKTANRTSKEEPKTPKKRRSASKRTTTKKPGSAKSSPAGQPDHKDSERKKEA